MPSTRRPAALDAVCGDPCAERFEARREGVELGEGAEVVLVPIGSKRGLKWAEVIGARRGEFESIPAADYECEIQIDE